MCLWVSTYTEVTLHGLVETVFLKFVNVLFKKEVSQMLALRKYVLVMGITVLIALFSVFGFSKSMRAEEKDLNGSGNFRFTVADISQDGEYILLLSSDLAVYDTDNSPTTNIELFLLQRFTGQILHISGDEHGEDDQGVRHAQFIKNDTEIVYVSTVDNHISGSDYHTFAYEYNIASASRKMLELPDNAIDFDVTEDGEVFVFRNTRSTEIFMYETATGQTQKLTYGARTSSGKTISISEDKSKVFFVNRSHDLDANFESVPIPSVFMFNRATSTFSLVAQNSSEEAANAPSMQYVVTSDGTGAAFWSTSTNLAEESEVNSAIMYFRDLTSGTTEALSVATDGTIETDVAGWPEDMTDDKRFVSFVYGKKNQSVSYLDIDYPSWGTNIFLRDRVLGTTQIVSKSYDGTPLKQWASSQYSFIRSNANLIFYTSHATNIVAGDLQDELRGLYVYNRTTDITELVFSIASIPTSEDLSVISVEAIQAVEDQPLILNKQTAVKVVVQKTGGEVVSAPVQVSYNGNTYSQFYVLNPENTANLGGQQSEVTFAESENTKVLYFFDTAFTPQNTGQYALSAMIDPLNAVNEADEVNNATTNSQTVITKDWGNLDPVLRIGLIKTDWDPSLDQEFNEYRATIEELLKGAFPVSDGDVEIVLLPRRSSSKRFREDGSNSTKFEIDNRLLGRWLREESVLNIIFHPRIDRYVHVVPPNWFVDNTEQIGYRVGLSDSGNKTTVLAEFVPVAGLHEVGHTYGLHLPPVCEDYEVFDPNTGMCEQDPERIGTKVELGLWVAKTRPMISTDFRPVYSFMGSVNESLEYWSTEQNYSQLISPPYSPPVSAKASTSSSNKVILAAGEVSITGTVKLDDWYVLENADYDSYPGSGDYVFSFLDESGSEIYTYPFSVGLQHSEADSTVSSFVVKLPYVDGVSKIQVIDSGSKQTLATKTVTQHAPSVNFILPAENQVVDDSVDIEWLGTDQDSEGLSYLLTYSGSGMEWQYVTSDQLRGNSYAWDTSELPAGDYKLSILASDGVNSSPVSTVAITVQHLQTEAQMIFLPFIAR